MSDPASIDILPPDSVLGSFKLSDPGSIPISWTEAASRDDAYREVLHREFTGYDLYVTSDNVIRWVSNGVREQEIMDEFGASDLNDLFGRCRADKNDPRVRELYKAKGVSLFMFWEVFYWEVNNYNQIDYQGKLSDEQYTFLLLQQ